jgi:hypothetical protein
MFAMLKDETGADARDSLLSRDHLGEHAVTRRL